MELDDKIKISEICIFFVLSGGFYFFFIIDFDITCNNNNIYKLKIQIWHIFKCLRSIYFFFFFQSHVTEYIAGSRGQVFQLTSVDFNPLWTRQGSVVL